MIRFNRQDLRSLDVALTYDDINIIPSYSSISSRSAVDTVFRFVGDVYLWHPLIPANMDTVSELEMLKAAKNSGSIGFYHRFCPVDESADAIRYMFHSIDETNPFPVVCGISIGTGDHELSRVSRCYDVFFQYRRPQDRLIFLIDVAHAHHKNIETMISHLRATTYNFVYLIAGNVADYYGAKYLLKLGVDGIKCGVGNGSLCETRIRTGVGVPQVSAILDCRQAIDEFCESRGLSGEKVPTLIADGGIKYPGDIVKAIGVGANSCMSGFMFAGTDATPGDVIKKGLFPNEREFKIYRGSASHSSKVDRGESRNIEGNVKEVPFRGHGSTEHVFAQTLDGIQSGFSYVGAKTVDDFYELVEFVRITQSGIIEARPNLLEL